MLTDAKIKQWGEVLIAPYDERRVQAIGYDLTSALFHTADDRKETVIELKPMQSVFVQCCETINLPDDMAAQVTLRNSRIRQGLMLTAPVYQPGHKTVVYFRVMNVGAEPIRLQAGDGLATVIFERLESAVERPYQGAFQNESTYRGMGRYAEAFAQKQG